MIDEWIRHLGTAFSPEQYVLWTRIECTAWTLADFVVVFMLLRLGDLARGIAAHERHRVSYLMLLLTVPLAAVIPIEPTGTYIFLIEILVTVPHFLIILYVLAVDARLFGRMLVTLTVK